MRIQRRGKQWVHPPLGTIALPIRKDVSPQGLQHLRAPHHCRIAWGWRYRSSEVIAQRGAPPCSEHQGSFSLLKVMRALGSVCSSSTAGVEAAVSPGRGLLRGKVVNWRVVAGFFKLLFPNLYFPRPSNSCSVPRAALCPGSIKAFSRDRQGEDAASVPPGPEPRFLPLSRSPSQVHPWKGRVAALMLRWHQVSLARLHLKST